MQYLKDFLPKDIIQYKILDFLCSKTECKKLFDEVITQLNKNIVSYEKDWNRFYKDDTRCYYYRSVLWRNCDSYSPGHITMHKYRRQEQFGTNLTYIDKFEYIHSLIRHSLK